MKTLRVTLADIVGPTGTPNSTATVHARYVDPSGRGRDVHLTDGTIVVPVRRTVAPGTVPQHFDFDVYANDAAPVREVDYGFLVEVSWSVVSPERAKTSGSRRVQVTESMGATVHLGLLATPTPIGNPTVSANFAASVLAAVENRVRHDAAQGLTDPQKSQARSNIGAGTSNFTGAYADLSGKPTLGTAAATAATDYATVAQGAKADTAVQPAAVTDAIVSTVGGGRPSTLVGATLTAGGTVLPVDVIGAKVYGADGVTLKSSTDDGSTWVTVCTLPYRPIRLLPTDDGEVLSVASGYIHKSSGWSTDPATATWALKVDGNATAGFYAFSVDGDGSKFIASEYSGTRADSRYVHVSTDAGATWSVVWDTVAQYPATHAESHVHGCCYDPWEDRFWFTEGHGEPRGFYYSEDDGATWVKLTGPNTDMAAMPTVLVATNDGIVCGTDDAPNGLLGIRRGGFAVEIVYQYWKPRAGAYGFAERGFRDPRTGLVYIGWRSEYAEVSAFILAGSATAGGLVWDSGVPAVSSRINNVIVSATGQLLAPYYDATIPDTVILSGRVGVVGSPNANTGNSTGGTSTDGRSLALGPSATTGAAIESTAIGYAALARGTLDTAVGKGASTVAAAGQSTAIGAAATTGATLATAIGANASASTTAATAIGANAASSGVSSAAIGAAASATQTQTTAVGRSAKAQVAADATAVGYSAVASGALSTAVGASATASNTRSLALGQGSTSAHISSIAFLGTSTVADNQVQFGARHLEIKENATTPAAASVDSVRLFARDNGSGKTQLCARFATGAIVVIATEP